MAEKTEKETSEKKKDEKQQDQTLGEKAADEQENVGEVSDTEQKEAPKREKKPRAEFTPLDLGNEDNVSDWLVNMLSARLWDFAINNMEWVGDLCDRAFFTRNEAKEAKRQMALNVKAAKQRAADASKKAITNEDGTINAAAAESLVYDDKGKLVQLGDYVIQPNDKLVDAEGKPLQGKTQDEINAQIEQSRKNVEAQKKAAEQTKSNSGKGKEKAPKEGKKKEGKKADGKKKASKGKEKAKGTKEKAGKSQKNTRARQKRSPKEAAQAARSTQQAKKDRAKQGQIASNKKRAVKQSKQATQSSKNRILNLSRQNRQSRANTNTINRSAKRDGRS